MKQIEKLSYQELQNEILFNNDGLYEMFDEEKFLKNQYTHKELIEITTKWIMEAPEIIYETI